VILAGRGQLQVPMAARHEVPERNAALVGARTSPEDGSPEGGALMRQVSYAYDTVGNRTSVTDYNGHTTYFSYDALNRLVSETNPLGETVYSCLHSAQRKGFTRSSTSSTPSPGRVGMGRWPSVRSSSGAWSTRAWCSLDRYG
jgi:YD repeat-containing protein